MCNYICSVLGRHWSLRFLLRIPLTVRSNQPFDYSERILPCIASDKPALPLIISFPPLPSQEKLAYLIAGEMEFNALVGSPAEWGFWGCCAAERLAQSWFAHLHTFRIFPMVFSSQSRQFICFIYIFIYSFSSVHRPKAAFLQCPLHGWAAVRCQQCLLPGQGVGVLSPVAGAGLLSPEKAVYRKQLPLHWNEFWMVSRCSFLWSASKFFFFS